MKRRIFLRKAALGSTAFLLDLGIHQVQPADAFLFLLLRGAIRNMAMRALVQSAFSSARSSWSTKDQSWYDDRIEAQLAQSKFLDHRFAKSSSDIFVADVNLPVSGGYILAAQRQEELGYNSAFCFSQMHDSEPSLASFAGPACIGMAYAAKYLREKEGMSVANIQNAILPTYQDYDDWSSWSQKVSYTSYRTLASQGGVEIEYRAVDRRPGGHGTIRVIVNAHRQIEIPIKVKYS
jgi:hypothetical protein